MSGGAVQIVANSPRSLASGFWATSALPPVSCADPSKVGVVLPRVLPASETFWGHAPMLYVQLRIETTILPALVDSGACDNFISDQAVPNCILKQDPLGGQLEFCRQMANPWNVRPMWWSRLSFGPCPFRRVCGLSFFGPCDFRFSFPASF